MTASPSLFLTWLTLPIAVFGTILLALEVIEALIDDYPNYSYSYSAYRLTGMMILSKGKPFALISHHVYSNEWLDLETVQ